MAEWPSFCSGAYTLEFANAGPDECWNLFVENVERAPRAGKLRLRQIPGLKAFTTMPTAPIRCLWAGDDRLFIVAGGSIYEVYQDGTFSPSLGNIGNGTNPAIISSNGFQLAVASAGQAYISSGPLVPIPGHPSDQSFVPILDSVAGQPILAGSLAFIDQYFVAAIANSKQVVISNLAPNGQIWDPGDTAIKEAYSDNIQRIWVDFPGGELVFLFGAQTQEIWQDTGGLFPFTRVSGAVFPIGCDSAWSVDGANGVRFWFWNQTVWRQQGTGAPTRISDYGIEQAIKGFPGQGIPGYSFYDLTNCEGACYLQGGHLFYHLSFPNAGVTWVYDDATGFWAKRAIWQNNQWGRYRPRLFAQQWGMLFGGDYETGDIYILDPATFTDAHGVALRRDRIAPYITDQMRNMRYNRLTLDLATGVGLQVAPGALGYDPQIGMRYSSDRGNTYSNWRNEALGKAGQYFKRVYWSNMGCSWTGETVHVSITDPIDTSISGAYIDVGPGTKEGKP